MRNYKKLIKNKSAEKFGSGILIVLITMSLSLFSFVTEENKITGLAVSNVEINNNDLLEFDNIKLLGYMSKGNYYIDNEGIVYWADDSSKPAVAMIKNIDESQKSRNIYIDESGRVGFVLKPVSVNG